MELLSVRWFDRTGGRYLPQGYVFTAARFPSAAVAPEAVERLFFARAADPDICGDGFLADPLFWDIQDDERWAYAENGGIIAEIFADETEVSATFYGFRRSRDRVGAIGALKAVCREMDTDGEISAAFCG